MPADYCGPFTIDDIDLFGTLEQINVSFDDPIWNSADTCIRYADGAVAGTGNVNANAFAIRNAVGAVNGATHSNASVTVCTLAAGADAANAAPASGASTCTITGYTTSSTPFYASRITTKHVYDQSNNKMRYKHNSQAATSTFANVVAH
jgi:hypothetical protein